MEQFQSLSKPVGVVVTIPSDGVNDPAPTQVAIEVVHWNGHGRVALVGEIDVSNVRDAEAGLIDMASAGTPIVLDVVRLSYLDSQGVAMFFRLARRAKVNGGTLTIANPQGIVRRVLEITHVGEAITIIDDA